jgi:hypothetical protein
MRQILLAAAALCIAGSGAAQSDDDGAVAVVQELYDLVTFEAGTTPDWAYARTLFLPEAVVVLRSSRDATTVFSVDGWIDDFVRFIEEQNVVETGFVERIVQTESMEFKDIAHVLVLYEAEIPGWGRPPQRAVDSFQLVRRDGRWVIASIANEVPDAEHPLPAVFRR